MTNEHPSVKYIAPFALFLVFLAIRAKVPLDSAWEAAVAVVILAAVCLACWPRELSVRPNRPMASIVIGTLVFVLWIAPELAVPGYRSNPLFSNSIVGHVHSSLQAAAFHNPWLLTWRTIRAVIIVPVVEELFWRAWLMRWLIDSDFRRVPLGTYAPFSFWVTAILFASEHGPYWDVGLLTGVIYNVWMIRSKSVANCILMHAVTNGALSAYVIATAQWQYWQ
ncbi:MAG: CAAX prenyl protease-related protein [Acidobacteriota bacterium]|nr:CAAX prenyl protease-related protein [Acidobacteriota bacterium]